MVAIHKLSPKKARTLTSQLNLYKKDLLYQMRLEKQNENVFMNKEVIHVAKS